MNIKDYRSIEMFIPIKYVDKEGYEARVFGSITAVRDGETVISIPNSKHSNAFLEMILMQVMTGFTMDQQPPQPGIPGHDVEVTMSPEETTNDLPCQMHVPIHHRDNKEAWCSGCGLNSDFNEPRVISFGKPAPIKRGAGSVEGP